MNAQKWDVMGERREPTWQEGHEFLVMDQGIVTTDFILLSLHFLQTGPVCLIRLVINLLSNCN